MSINANLGMRDSWLVDLPSPALFIKDIIFFNKTSYFDLSFHPDRYEEISVS
jgi:hypothetical protein